VFRKKAYLTGNSGNGNRIPQSYCSQNGGEHDKASPIKFLGLSGLVGGSRGSWKGLEKIKQCLDGNGFRALQNRGDLKKEGKQEGSQIAVGAKGKAGFWGSGGDSVVEDQCSKRGKKGRELATKQEVARNSDQAVI